MSYNPLLGANPRPTEYIIIAGMLAVIASVLLHRPAPKPPAHKGTSVPLVIREADGKPKPIFDKRVEWSWSDRCYDCGAFNDLNGNPTCPETCEALNEARTLEAERNLP